MSEEPEKIVHTTNRYLDKITAWNEKKVAGYKKRVAYQLLSPWTSALLFALLFTALRYVWAFVAPKLAALSVGVQITVCVAMYALPTLLYCILSAEIRLRRFVHKTRGEVGHKGEPYYRSVFTMIFVSLGLWLILLVGAYFLFVKELSLLTFDTISDLFPLVFAAGFPFLSYLVTFIHLLCLPKSACPHCGRFDTLKTEKRLLGKKREGSYLYSSYDHASVKKAKKTAPTEEKPRPQPIYGDIVSATLAIEDETDMDALVTFCKYCSLYAEGSRKEAIAAIKEEVRI